MSHPIAQELARRGWRHEDLAEKAAISPRTVHNIIHRLGSPQQSTRRLVFRALGWRWCPDKARKVFGPHPKPKGRNGRA